MMILPDRIVTPFRKQAASSSAQRAVEEGEAAAAAIRGLVEEELGRRFADV